MRDPQARIRTRWHLTNLGQRGFLLAQWNLDFATLLVRKKTVS